MTSWGMVELQKYLSSGNTRPGGTSPARECFPVNQSQEYTDVQLFRDHMSVCDVAQHCMTWPHTIVSRDGMAYILRVQSGNLGYSDACWAWRLGVPSYSTSLSGRVIQVLECIQKMQKMVGRWSECQWNGWWWRDVGGIDGLGGMAVQMVETFGSRHSGNTPASGSYIHWSFPASDTLVPMPLSSWPTYSTATFAAIFCYE